MDHEASHALFFQDEAYRLLSERCGRLMILRPGGSGYAICAGAIMTPMMPT
jgi:hypothetical protein